MCSKIWKYGRERRVCGTNGHTAVNRTSPSSLGSILVEEDREGEGEGGREWKCERRKDMKREGKEKEGAKYIKCKSTSRMARIKTNNAFF